MKKHLVAQLKALKAGAEKAAIVGVTLLAPAAAFADTTAQPDTTDAVAYIGAGIATYLVIKNSHFLMNAAAYVSNWATRAFGGR